jgi:hypothetical protein
MNVDTRVEPLEGRLPTVEWRWDIETDILSGGFRSALSQGGQEGSVELSDEEGSVIVLDVADGVLCGLDVVVWPEVSTRTDIQVPAQLTDGRVVLASSGSRGAVSSLEVDTSLSVETNASESVFHLRIGPRRSGEVVRAADNFYVELDRQGGLAGFWMTNVPPFTAIDEE